MNNIMILSLMIGFYIGILFMLVVDHYTILKNNNEIDKKTN